MKVGGTYWDASEERLADYTPALHRDLLVEKRGLHGL
jgi:hypothetical protein